MPDPQKLTLTKPWGRYRKGATLTCWEHGMALGEGVVDPKRFATLRERGYDAPIAADVVVLDATSFTEPEPATAFRSTGRRKKGAQ